MAIGTKLVFNVGTTAGKKTWTFNYAKNNSSVANIKALANGLLNRSTFFMPQPLLIDGAKLVTTTESVIDIS